MMETNRIIEELRSLASMSGWDAQLKDWWNRQADDARPVNVSRLEDVVTPAQYAWFREHYRAQKGDCYKNASAMVRLLVRRGYVCPIRYVEGYAYSDGMLPIEHAFVRFGEHYIDPTFEFALNLDVRKEQYVSCIEFDPQTMEKLLAELGGYGGLYLYHYLSENVPDLAAKMRV